MEQCFFFLNEGELFCDVLCFGASCMLFPRTRSGTSDIAAHAGDQSTASLSYLRQAGRTLILCTSACE